MHADIDSDADADFYSDVDADVDAVVDKFSPVLQIFIASCPWAICLCLNSWLAFIENNFSINV